MRVTIEVSSYYDWQPVPPDAVVTKQDVASGRVKPSFRNDGSYDMRVTRKGDTHTTVTIAESTIIARIVFDLMPQNGGRQLTRKQAVANLLSANVMPHHAHPKHFRKITVDVDDGPDEKLLRELLAPYTVAKHVSGVWLIDPEDVEDIVAAYMAPATVEDHETHLAEHFGVKGVAK